MTNIAVFLRENKINFISKRICLSDVIEGEINGRVFKIVISPSDVELWIKGDGTYFQSEEELLRFLGKALRLKLL